MTAVGDEHRHGHDRSQGQGPGDGPRGHGGADHEGHSHHHSHGIAGLIRSILAPHSHDSADTIAAALTATDEGVRALEVSLALLALTATIEVVVVVASRSVALLSDAIHNFADALTAVPLGVAFWMGRRPPTDRYTYGFGRAEDLAGIGIVALMAASSVLAGWEAVDRLVRPRAVSGLGWVAAAGLVGFAGNEAVAVYRIRVGRRIGSAALVADGRHARTDGLTSLAVVGGAVGVAAGWKAADPVIGLVITVAILLVVRNAARDIYRRLMDSVDPELVAAAEEVLGGAPGVSGVAGVRLRWVGHELLAEATIVTDGSQSLASAHAVAEGAHHRLLHGIPRLAQATIHVDPAVTAGHDHHRLTAHHFPDTTPEPGAVPPEPGANPPAPEAQKRS